MHGAGSRAALIVDDLLKSSEEFSALWSQHEVGGTHDYLKRIVNPEVGVLSLNRQVLLDPLQDQALLVYTATPGSESYEKLQLLSVIGSQPLR